MIFEDLWEPRQFSRILHDRSSRASSSIPADRMLEYSGGLLRMLEDYLHIEFSLYLMIFDYSDYIAPYAFRPSLVPVSSQSRPSLVPVAS